MFWASKYIRAWPHMRTIVIMIFRKLSWWRQWRPGCHRALSLRPVLLLLSFLLWPLWGNFQLWRWSGKSHEHQTSKSVTGCHLTVTPTAIQRYCGFCLLQFLCCTEMYNVSPPEREIVTLVIPWFANIGITENRKLHEKSKLVPWFVEFKKPWAIASLSFGSLLNRFESVWVLSFLVGCAGNICSRPDPIWVACGSSSAGQLKTRSPKFKIQNFKSKIQHRKKILIESKAAAQLVSPTPAAPRST